MQNILLILSLLMTAPVTLFAQEWEGTLPKFNEDSAAPVDVPVAAVAAVKTKAAAGENNPKYELILIRKRSGMISVAGHVETVQEADALAKEIIDRNPSDCRIQLIDSVTRHGIKTYPQGTAGNHHKQLGMPDESESGLKHLPGNYITLRFSLNRQKAVAEIGRYFSVYDYYGHPAGRGFRALIHDDTGQRHEVLVLRPHAPREHHYLEKYSNYLGVGIFEKTWHYIGDSVEWTTETIEDGIKKEGLIEKILFGEKYWLIPWNRFNAEFDSGPHGVGKLNIAEEAVFSYPCVKIRNMPKPD